MSTLVDDSALGFDAIKLALPRHLGLTSDDPNLPAWYNWCLGEASDWLSNSWTDADGDDIEKTSNELSTLKTGLFEGVRTLRQSYNKAQGINKLKTAAVEEQYVDVLIGASLARQTLAAWLYRLRLKVYLL